MNCLDFQESKTIVQLWENTFRRSVGEERFIFSPDLKNRDNNLTYKEVNANAHCIAAYLLKKGVQKGDCVAVLSRQSPWYVSFDLAIQFLGCVNVTLPENFSELSYTAVEDFLKNSACKAVLISHYALYQTHKALLDRVATGAEIIVHVQEEEEISEADRFTALERVIKIGQTDWRENNALLQERKRSADERDICMLVVRIVEKQEVQAWKLAHVDVLQVLAKNKRLASAADRQQWILSLNTEFILLYKLAAYYYAVGLGLKQAACEANESGIEKLELLRPLFLVATPEVLEIFFHHLQQDFQKRHRRRAKYLSLSIKLALAVDKYATHQQKPPFMVRLKYRWAYRYILKSFRKTYFPNVQSVFSEGVLDDFSSQLLQALQIPVEKSFT